MRNGGFLAKSVGGGGAIGSINSRSAAKLRAPRSRTIHSSFRSRADNGLYYIFMTIKKKKKNTIYSLYLLGIIAVRISDKKTRYIFIASFYYFFFSSPVVELMAATTTALHGGDCRKSAGESSWCP